MKTLAMSPLDWSVDAVLKYALRSASLRGVRYSEAAAIRKFALSPLDGRLSAALASRSSISGSAFGTRISSVVALSPLELILDSAPAPARRAPGLWIALRGSICNTELRSPEL